MGGLGGEIFLIFSFFYVLNVCVKMRIYHTLYYDCFCSGIYLIPHWVSLQAHVNNIVFNILIVRMLEYRQMFPYQCHNVLTYAKNFVIKDRIVIKKKEEKKRKAEKVIINRFIAFNMIMGLYSLPFNILLNLFYHKITKSFTTKSFAFSSSCWIWI